MKGVRAIGLVLLAVVGVVMLSGMAWQRSPSLRPQATLDVSR